MDINEKQGRANRNRNSKKEGLRDVDFLTQDVASWWGRTFVFIKSTRVKTWKGVFILAFIAGAAAAAIWTVSINIQTKSKAADNARLELFTDDTSVVLDSGSSTVNMDILLNTDNEDVVAVRAVVNYDPQVFRLDSWSTDDSAFAAGNGCIYPDTDGKPCEIVDDTVSGTVSITVAKPSPGIKEPSAIVGHLVFQALQATAPASSPITLSYTSGSYSDSDVIKDDGSGTDILGGVTDSDITVYASAPAVCTDFTYSAWSICQSNGTQTRTVETYIPEGCVGGVVPVLTQNCTFVPPTCDTFEYSSWGACQPNGTQSRTVTSSSPAGCEGGNPDLEQGCEYSGGPVTCDDDGFEYSVWGACQPNGTQSRTVTSSSPDDCSGGSPNLTQNCTFTLPTCTSFAYSDWGACQSNNTQSRTALSGSPAGCQGGSQELTQSCTYNSPSSSPSNNDNDDDDDDDDDDDKPKDKEKPKFTDLPYFLNKVRGSMVWWKAKDNKGVSYYTYNFNGKKVKTKRKHFIIPATTPRGVYLLRVKAFDKAGNSKSRLVTVRVR